MTLLRFVRPRPRRTVAADEQRQLAAVIDNLQILAGCRPLKFRIIARAAQFMADKERRLLRVDDIQARRVTR